MKGIEKISSIGKPVPLKFLYNKYCIDVLNGLLDIGYRMKII